LFGYMTLTLIMACSLDVCCHFSEKPIGETV